MRRLLAAVALLVSFLALYGYDARAQVANTVPPFRYQEQPTVEIPNVYYVLLNYTSLANLWTFGDSPCGGSSGCTPGPMATQLADSVGLDTVASPSPSPVPLNVSSPTASPWPYCGNVGLVQDGSTSCEVDNQQYCGSGCSPKNGEFFSTSVTGVYSELCNSNAGAGCTNAFSVLCIVMPQSIPYTNQVFYSGDGTGGLQFGDSLTTGLTVTIGATTLPEFFTMASGVPYVILYTFNPSDSPNTSHLYVDQTTVAAFASPTPAASPNSTTYFGAKANGSFGFNGRLQYCADFDAELARSDAEAIYLATGFW